MVTLSSTGEIGDFQDIDQFQPAKTQFACGYFSGAIIKAMAQVGQPPTQSVQAMINEAETWYADDHGNNSISNTSGMSLQEEYDLIVNRMGLHYQGVALDANAVRGWVRAGYPVMLTISETSVFDLALGGNPYTAWRPAGTHIFVVTGIANDGNFLVRDPANCTSLYNPNSLRPGPRHYDASRLQIWTATVVVPPWLPRPTSAIPPTPTQQEEPLMVNISDVADFFEDLGNDVWRNKQYNTLLGHGMLRLWRSTPTPLAMIGLPRTNETPVPGHPGVVIVVCERMILIYDPHHEIDNPPGAGDVYGMHIDNLNPGVQQLLELLNISTAPAPTINTADLVAQLHTIAGAASVALKDLGA